MSETETIKGKLRPTGKTVGQFLDGDDLPTWCDPDNSDDMSELLADRYHEKAVVIDGKVYEVESANIEDIDIFESTKNPDGTIDFLVKYYNGGCCFDEAIEQALKS